jgi:hypothetical protein
MAKADRDYSIFVEYLVIATVLVMTTVATATITIMVLQ